MSKKIFIGGPISSLMNENGFDSEFKRLHESVVSLLENKGYIILSAHIVEKYGARKFEPDEVIVNRDLTWIEEADACVFLLPTNEDRPIRTDGTFIEIGYALAKCNKIIAFWDLKKKFSYSPMFRGVTNKNVQMYDISEIKDVLSRFE